MVSANLKAVLQVVSDLAVIGAVVALAYWHVMPNEAVSGILTALALARLGGKGGGGGGSVPPPAGGAGDALPVGKVAALVALVGSLVGGVRHVGIVATLRGAS